MRGSVIGGQYSSTVVVEWAIPHTPLAKWVVEAAVVWRRNYGS